MTLINYKFETDDEIFEGQHKTDTDASVLKGSSAVHGTTEGAIAWRKIRKEILDKLPIRAGAIRRESLKVDFDTSTEKITKLAKQQKFETIFNGTSIEPKIGNPKISGSWLIYDSLTSKAFNNLAQKAKDAGFKSAFYRDGKIGVLVEDVK